jgi:chromate transporter
VAEVFAAFLRLGLTSFGGPVAHLGYFRAEFVERRGWLAEAAYADLVALCQSLPGPASSQVGMSIGLLRAGLPGALAAWAGFTLPSAIAMVLFAYGLPLGQGAAAAGLLHGLQVAAVAVVAIAVLGMARTLAPDRPRASIAVGAAVLVLLVPAIWAQVGVIGLGGAIGFLLLREGKVPDHAALPGALSRRRGVWAIGLFLLLLAGLPILAARLDSHGLALFDAFYRAGSLVFGGGHVVLPLLQAAVVPPGWIGNDAFLSGYGAVQAVPGPLFTFSAFLGAAMHPSPNGWAGAAICLVAIFLPSLLLVAGVLPFWDRLRRLAAAQAGLRGVNAAVVGLLMAALYDPVWISAIRGPADLALAIVAFLLLYLWRLPPWLVVVLSGVGGAVAGVL